MDVESVRSGRSDRSGASALYQSRPLPRPPPAADRDPDAAEGSSTVGVVLSAGKPQQTPTSPRSQSSSRSRHHHHRGNSKDSRRPTDPSEPPASERELEILNHSGGNPDDKDTPTRGCDGNGGPRLRTQLSEQDDNWGETTTAVTGTTSEAGFSSVENMSRLNKQIEESVGFACARYIGTVVAGIVGVLAFVSPIIMVVLPKTGIIPNNDTSDLADCKADCEGQLIGFVFKLVILLVGSWALFFRRPRVTLPRISVFRALVVLFVFIVTIAYWLFYGVRVLSAEPPQSYPEVVSFCVSMVDALLFIHYLAVVLLELRHLQPYYVVKLVRSPDGASKSYTVGQLSVQRLALRCLDQYYRDFQVYNPYLDHVMSRRSSRMTDFKIYNVDGTASDTTASSAHHSRAMIAAMAASGSRGGGHRSGGEGSVSQRGHNDRFYDELDYERKVRKRKARLLVAAEEAFTHVRRLQNDKGSAVELSPMEAAQAIFPGLARALQKYLRATRQQPRYTVDGILDHLALCISHDMSAKAFVERYLSQGEVIWNDKECGGSSETHTWSVVSVTGLNVGIGDGTVVRMSRGDTSLLATVRVLPHFNLTEDIFSPKNNKFALRISSETSV